MRPEEKKTTTESIELYKEPVAKLSPHLPNTI